MNFRLKKIDNLSKARLGILEIKEEKIETPVFMPVGTLGTIKAISQKTLNNNIKAKIVLSNAYHLFLRPGIKIISQAGGLHSFINWNKIILTDSGGYQVYSLLKKRRINENGVIFKSHINGLTYKFTPENVINIQRAIGSNILMAFDECTKYPCNYFYAKESMNLTHRWLLRSCRQFDLTASENNNFQELFPIIQGSTYKELRKISTEFVVSQNRGGNAIGGICKPSQLLYEIIDLICNILPSNKPRYLMGVGTPVDILECISLGIDMFDCVMPTRNGRNGTLFTTQGLINIKNQKWKKVFSVIDKNINNNISNYYTKSYLYHLIKSQEILGIKIASIHNLSFYLWLIKNAKKNIKNNNFSKWKNKIIRKIMKKI